MSAQQKEDRGIILMLLGALWALGIGPTILGFFHPDTLLPTCGITSILWLLPAGILIFIGWRLTK